MIEIINQSYIVFWFGSILFLILLIRAFICKKVTDIHIEGKKEIPDNAAILKDIYENGFHISTLETKNDFAKYLARKASKQTNIFYFLIFLSTFLPFFLKGMNAVIPLFVVIVILFLGFILQAFAAWKIKGKDFANDFFNIDYNQVNKYTRQYLRGFAYIPFSVRNIWWLILIMGLFGVQFETLKQSGNLNNTLYVLGSEINNELLNKYLLEFFRVFVISIVAYIATNIIRELTLLRERYIIGAKQVSDLNNELQLFGPSFKKTTDEIEKSTTAIKDTLKASEMASHIISFIDKFKNSPEKIKERARLYIEKSNLLTKSLNDSISENDNQYIQVSHLSVRTSLIKNQAERVISGHSGAVLTTWSNLGIISKYLMNNIFNLDELPYKKIEIYALQLKTPKEFIEKYFDVTGADDETTKETKKWREFVNENIFNVKNEHVIIKRYFAKIDKNFISCEEKRPEEYNDLVNADNISDLNKVYYIDETKNSQSNSSIDQQMIYGNKDEKLNEKTLKIILSEYIHKKDHCFIRTFSDNINEKELIVEESKLGKNKFIDYLAVYLRNEDQNGEWLFCVKSLYDKGFDAAKITLYQKKDNCNIWSKMSENLNTIFFTNEGKCKEIGTY